MCYETEYLFPFLLGQVEELDTEYFGNYNHSIKWTKGYPRKLDGEDWIVETSKNLSEYTQGKFYLDMIINPSIKLNITGYPSGGVFSFLVISCDERHEFYYNPFDNKKFIRVN